MSNGHDQVTRDTLKFKPLSEREPTSGLDFSDLIQAADTAKVAQRATPSLDFSDLVSAPAPITEEDQQRQQFHRLRDSLYSRMGMPRGAWMGIADMITDAAISATQSGMARTMTRLAMPASLPGTASDVGRDLAGAGREIVGAARGLGGAAGATWDVTKAVGSAATLDFDPISQVSMGLIDGYVKPMLWYPIALTLRSNFGQDTQYDPDERYEMGRVMASNWIGTIAGAYAGQALKAGMIGQRALLGRQALSGLEKFAKALTAEEMAALTSTGSLSSLQIQAIGKAVAKSDFWTTMTQPTMRRLARTAGSAEFVTGLAAGLTEAAVGGFTTGYIETEGTPEERIRAGVTLAAVALPFGVVAEMIVGGVRKVRGKPYLPEVIAQTAGKLAQLRAINDVANRSVPQVLLDVNTLMETGRFDVALAKTITSYETLGVDANGTPKMYGRGAFVIPGTDNPFPVISAVAALKKADEPGWVTQVHLAKDGTFDVLVYPEQMPMDKKRLHFFSETGYLHGQQVGYRGTDGLWFIDEITRTETQKKDRVTLRNARTDEIVTNVPVRKITRPTSNLLGDLFLSQDRMISKEDVLDPSLGLARRGNNLPMNFGGADDLKKMHANANDMAHSFLGESQLVPSKDGQTLSVQRADGTTQALVPGLNKIEYLDPATGRKKGVHLFVGGYRTTMRTPTASGKSLSAPVKIGQPGEILGYMAWQDVPGRKGKKVRGADYYVIAQEHLMHGRKVVSDMMAEGIAKEGIQLYVSTASPGAQSAMARIRNKYSPERLFNRFGYINLNVVMDSLYEGFVDFIGLTGGKADFTDHINRVGIDIGQPARGSGPRPDIATAGIPGQTREALLNKINPEQHDILPGQTEGMADVSAATKKGRTYYTESDVKLTEGEAIALLHEQNAAGDVPHHQKPYDFAADRVTHSCNDMVNLFAAELGLNPKIMTHFRSFIEHRMGQELLGLGPRKPNVNRTSVHWLTERVGQLDKDLDLAYKLTEEPGWERDTHANVGPEFKRLWDDAEDKGLKLPDVIKNLESERAVFQRRLDLLENPDPIAFSDADREVFERLTNEARSLREQAATDLVNTAMCHGFYIDRDPGGIIKIRDAETYKLQSVTFDTEDAAREWIEKTGNPNGPDIDGGGQNPVPPRAVMIDSMPPIEPPVDPWSVPFAFHPNSSVTKMANMMKGNAPWFTPKRAFFVAIDDMFGTTLFRDVYVPLYQKKLQMEAAKRVPLQLAKDVETLLTSSKIPRERWKTISDNREAMSPTEVVTGIYTDRRMTDIEVEKANWLAQQNIDTKKVFEFGRECSKFRGDFRRTRERLLAQGLDENGPEIAALTKEHGDHTMMLREAFDIDDAHMAAHDMFLDVRTKNPKNERIFGIVRLHQSLSNNEPGRYAHAQIHKLTKEELQAVQKLDELYDKVATDLGIPRTIGQYMNHYRIAGDFDNSFRNVDLNGNPLKSGDVRDFASEMMRTGELDAFERDPIRAMVSYINASYNACMFNDTWNTVVKRAQEEIDKIPHGSKRVASVTAEYVFGLRGHANAADELAQAAMDKFIEQMGWSGTVDVKRDLFNTMIAAQSGAMLGFRPAQAVRDFAGFSKNYYARFGSARWRNAIDLAFTRGADGQLPIRKLAESGKIPGLSFIEFLSEEELVSGLAGKSGNKIRDAIMKTSQNGLIYSGQHISYSIAHAMAYLDTFSIAAKQLRDLHAGTVTKRQAYMALSINTYDIPVAQAFDDLVKVGKFDEAAEFIAQQTGAETAFIFGMQNHPFGWGSNFGKMAGQFGQFGIFERNFLTRLAGRGTLSERAAGMARLAAAETATFLAGRTLGFNMRSWYLLPATIFLGGPMLQRAQNMAELTGQRGKMRQALSMRENESYGGKIPWLSTAVPGAFALSDYYQAYELAQNRYGPVPVIGRALGFSVDQTQRSFLDELSGAYPRVKGRR